MNLYEVTFDATTFIVLAETKDDLFNLLNKYDGRFRQKADGTIFYVCTVDQNREHIVFTVSH